MTPLEAIQLIISIVLAVVTARQAYVTNKLDQRLYRLNTNLDQRIQRLHRAREAVIERNKAFVFLQSYTDEARKTGEFNPSEAYFQVSGELSAATAELQGLALAIGDNEFLELVAEASNFQAEGNLILQAQKSSKQLHARISQLLLEVTADAPASAQAGDWRTV